MCVRTYHAIGIYLLHAVQTNGNIHTANNVTNTCIYKWWINVNQYLIYVWLNYLWPGDACMHLLTGSSVRHCFGQEVVQSQAKDSEQTYVIFFIKIQTFSLTHMSSIKRWSFSTDLDVLTRCFSMKIQNNTSTPGNEIMDAWNKLSSHDLRPVQSICCGRQHKSWPAFCMGSVFSS